MKLAAAVHLILLLAITGCSNSPSRHAATGPSGVSVVANDFDRLMSASESVSRELLFKPTVRDYRTGVLRTEPLLSAQWFEPWRRDVQTPTDAAESSLAKVRRTLTVRIEKDAAGSFVARPEVLVERYSLSERRMTTAAGYRSIYRERYRPTGNSLTDSGINAPDAYWYAVGNDPALERYIAKQIQNRLANQS